jgi:hypothetical protein
VALDAELIDGNAAIDQIAQQPIDPVRLRVLKFDPEVVVRLSVDAGTRSDSSTGRRCATSCLLGKLGRLARVSPELALGAGAAVVRLGSEVRVRPARDPPGGPPCVRR